MTVSTWVQQSISGNTTTGSALPVITVDIPANKKLARVVIYGHCGGVATNQGGYDKIGSVYMLMTLSLGFPTTNLKEIWHARRLVPMNPVALDDHNLLTNSRIYTAYYGAGDQELGDNLQMSWGGNPSPAMRITSAGGFFLVHPSTLNFIMYYTLFIRALYQA